MEKSKKNENIKQNETKKFRNRNIIFVLCTLLIIILAFWFVKTNDPYSLNDMEIYPISSRDFYLLPDESLYHAINLNKNVKYDFVNSGSSASYTLISNEYFNKKTGKRLFMLNRYMISAQSQYELLKYFIECHPEVKTVLVSIELNSFLRCNKTVKKYDINNKIRILWTLYFSKNAFQKSFQKFKQSLFPQPDVDYLVIQPHQKYCDFKDSCEVERIEYIKKINDMLEARNIKAIYYIPPVHGLELAYLKSEGLYEKLENLKRDISEIVPFYDMAFINKYTTTPKYYWADVLHPMYFRKEFVDLMNYNIENPEFAIKITSDNRENIINSQRKALDTYIQNNSKKINEFINDGFTWENSKKYEEKIYLKDFPREIQEEYFK